MPTYRYRCNVCGDFDYRQSMSDVTLAYCPTCHAAVQKLFNSSPVIFSGSGFYSTDNRDK